MSGDSGSNELHEATRGGERVLIRQAQPEDVALYPAFLRQVSTADLRLRFFADVAELSAAEIGKLAHPDYKHDMAFVALDEDTGDILGLVRLKGELDEKTAEFAILVRTRLKGHGLGWLLMRRIIDYAKEKGLRRIYGDVLVEIPLSVKCAPNSASTKWTWERFSRVLCLISKISTADRMSPWTKRKVSSIPIFT